MTLSIVLCTAKRWPKLKSRYKVRVGMAIEYVRTIDDFNDLVDPRTLAFHCLGLEPFAFVLRNIEIEEKKSLSMLCFFLFLSLSFVFFCFFFFNKCFAKGMTTKFNQRMYAKMRGKKNEPLSSIGKRTVQVVEKGISVTPPVTVAEPSRTASPATSVKEINPIWKRPWVEDKENDKANSLLSSVFTMLALHC